MLSDTVAKTNILDKKKKRLPHVSTTVRVEHIFEHKQPPTHTTRAFYYATIYFEREREKKTTNNK